MRGMCGSATFLAPNGRTNGSRAVCAAIDATIYETHLTAARGYPMVIIDKHSHTPAYRQLFLALRSDSENGVYRPGTKLPALP